MGLVAPPAGLSDNKYLAGTAASPSASLAVRASARPRTRPRSAWTRPSWLPSLPNIPRRPIGPPPPRSVDGLPLVKPPYGLLTAINLDTGDTLWQVPHGDTPDEIRNNPALKGLNIPKTGQNGQCGG